MIDFLVWFVVGTLIVSQIIIFLGLVDIKTKFEKQNLVLASRVRVLTERLNKTELPSSIHGTMDLFYNGKAVRVTSVFYPKNKS